MMTCTDKKIVEEINNKTTNNPNFWSFEEVNSKSGIHRIMRYPATMVPEMIEELIPIICKHSKAKNLLDPFMGSGTVLVEGIKNGLDVYGMDINPMAYFLCYVKTHYISITSLNKAFYKLEKDIENGLELTKIHDFKNIDKWFREDIKIDLSKLKNWISKIDNKNVRYFYELVFADLITAVKNSQSSTFKLHIKKEYKILEFKYNVQGEYLKKLKQSINAFDEYYKMVRIRNSAQGRSLGVNVNIKCGDNKRLGKYLKLENQEIDLIVTSPPYGDNSTTVTYGQFSILPLLWINSELYEKKFNSELLSNFSAIDTASLGGKLYSRETIENSGILEQSRNLSTFYNKLIKKGANDKARKVASFILDYYYALIQQTYVLKKDGYMILIVGNRKVHNTRVPFDSIINELLKNQFYKLKGFQRKIRYKTIASKISRVDEEAVESMSDETILVYRKK